MNRTNPKRSSFRSILLCTGLIAAVGVVISLAIREIMLQQKMIGRLEQQKKNAARELDELRSLQFYGMQALSIQRELEGWSSIESLSVPLFDYFTHPPEPLILSHFRMERTVLYRPLTETYATPFFRYSICFGGYISVELRNNTSEDKPFVMPHFFDETNSRFDEIFRFDQEDPEEGTPTGRRDTWRLHAQFEPTPAWSVAKSGGVP